jgi:hypothetical protein
VGIICTFVCGEVGHSKLAVSCVESGDGKKNVKNLVDMADTCPRATADMVVDMVTTLVTNMGTVAVEEDMEVTVVEDMEGMVVVVDMVVEDTWWISLSLVSDSLRYKGNYFCKV